MTRRLALPLALLLGVVAAVLLSSGVGARSAGHSLDCTTVVNAAAVTTAQATGGADRACHRALVHRTELAGGVLLLCLIAGTAAVAEAQDKQTSPGRRPGLA